MATTESTGTVIGTYRLFYCWVCRVGHADTVACKDVRPVPPDDIQERK